MLERLFNWLRVLRKSTPEGNQHNVDYPVTLLKAGVKIGVIEKGSYETPWFCSKVSGLIESDFNWMERATKFSRFLNELDDLDLPDEEVETRSAIAIQEMVTSWDELSAFDQQLSVKFFSGDIFQIGPAYFDEGFLEWRNGQQIS